MPGRRRRRTFSGTPTRRCTGAKEQGGTYSVFDPDMYVRARGRLDLEGDLRRTLEAPHEHLPVFYQPLVSIPKGAIVGMEALLRWAHPRSAACSPLRDSSPRPSVLGS